MAVAAAYFAMIELLDEVIGGVLPTLERTGQRDDTLVMFMSDHGRLLKGCRFFEGLIRVPLLLSWPRGLRNGEASDAPVELVDIATTLLEAAGGSRRLYTRALAAAPAAQERRRHRAPPARCAARIAGRCRQARATTWCCKASTPWPCPPTSAHPRPPSY